QRFAQLVKDSRILDGDDGLAGEGLEHRKLLVRKRPRVNATDTDSADCGIAPHHREDCRGPVSARKKISAAGRKRGWRLPSIRQIDKPAIENGGTIEILARKRNREPAPYCFSPR